MRAFEVYRGGELLGRIVLDDGVGGRWEPAGPFRKVRDLFYREAAFSMRALQADDDRDRLQAVADEAMSAIMAPGIVMHPNDGTQPFELIALMIDGDRATWR